MLTHSNAQIERQTPDTPATARQTGDLPLAELQRRAGALAREALVNIYQEYRHDFLFPFAALAPLGREIIRLRSELRLQWFESLSESWLKLAQRKIVVFPHGIYTITYRQDRRRLGQMVAAILRASTMMKLLSVAIAFAILGDEIRVASSRKVTSRR